MFGNAFGSVNNNTAAPGGGLFGAAKPATTSTGFGFGATSSANSTPTPNPPTNLFGNKQASTNTGGLFGSSNINNTAASGGLFGNSSNSANTAAPATGGLFGNNNNGSTSTSGGLFGAKPATSSTSGGLFGSNSTTNPTSTTGGLFGSKPAAPATSGGLFGNSGSTTGGLFANSTSNTAGATGGLFGAKPAATATSGGLFGNTTTNPSTGGLFGSSQQATSGGLFGNNTTTAQAPAAVPVKQYNVKDLPKSITESIKPKSPAPASPTLHNANLHSRKRSLSTSGNSMNNELLKSTIINKLGSTFNSTTSKINYNSEGLFSPRKDIISSSLAPLSETSTAAKYSSPQFASILRTNGSNRSYTSGRSNAISDYLKLKVDPSRSEAMKLKIFGETGNAQKIRILGKENVETLSVTEVEVEETKQINGNVVVEGKKEFVEVTTQETNGSTPLTEPTNIEAQQQQEQDVSASIIETNADEYWCSPSIFELSKYQLRQLSNVSNFTIGRRGYGTIWFQDPVDLSAFWSNLQGHLFGKIVRFKNKTVEVYPEGSVPFGTGLNVPAIITIEKLFPVIKARKAGEVIDKDYQLRLFVKKLKEQREMDFITYDPINGNWTFKVKHFSVWGIVDEDTVVIDMDEVRKQEEEEQKKAQKQEERKEEEDIGLVKKIRDEPIPTFEEQLILKRQRLQTNNNHIIPGAFIFDDSVIEVKPPSSAKFFKLTEPVVEDYQAEKLISRAENENFQLTKIPTEIEVEPLEEVEEKDYEPLEVQDEDFANLDAEPQLETSDDWDTQLELAGKYSSAFGNGKLFQVMNGGSVKNLSQLNKILYEKEIQEAEDKMEEDSEEEQQPRDREEVSTPVVPLTNKQIVEDIYETHLSQIQIAEASSFPSIQRNAGFQFKSLVDSFKRYNSNAPEFQVWQLASVLFDVIPQNATISDPAISARILETRRREGLVNWLSTQLQTELNIRYDSQSDTFEKIYTLLLQLKIPEASKLAIKTKNSHLAVLISLLGSNDPQVKESAKAQLNDWKRNSLLHGIPRGIVKIYYLLAGDDYVLKNFTDEEQLSWRSKLSMLLSYGDLNQPLESLLLRFIQSASTNVKRDEKVSFDLFKLFIFKHNNETNIDASSIFKPENTDEDVTVKWYIYDILVRSTGQLTFPSHTAVGDALTERYATQLESQGLLEISLFIILHYSQTGKARELITESLNRNIKKFTDSQIGKLLSTFHIPSTIIHSAKAKYYHCILNYWSEASSLIDAELLNDAHDLILKEVAPEAVINNGSKLVKLESLINRFPDSPGTAKGWDTGLVIYKTYLKYLKSQNRSALSFLLSHLPTLQVTNFRVNVAVQIMSKVVARDVLKVINDEDEEGENLDLDLELVWKLPLSESDFEFLKGLSKGGSGVVVAVAGKRLL